LALYGGEWLASRPGRFTLRKECRFPFKGGGWVAPELMWVFWRRGSFYIAARI